jgi:hypothetical protein
LGKAVEFIAELAGRVEDGWRPVIFGRWATQYAKKLQTPK